jgi:nicotinate-nucleotide adenylyltransferase
LVTKGGRRVGILGGTFDPPHIGHLVAAVSVRHELGLDVVLMVPNGDPWQKSGGRTITDAEVRLRMVEAAAAGLDGLEVCDVEARRRGPSYTVETVREMRSSEPDIDITLVLGRDAAALLPTWHRSEELLAEVSLALVDRPGAEIVAGPVGADDAPLVPMPQIGVSSSEIRRRVADGRPITVLVPAAVAELIERHGLYRP